MKLDINLMADRKMHGNHLTITALILFIIIILFAFVLPIKYRNSLVLEKEKTNQELVYINKTNSEYLHLKNQLASLSKRIEINDQIEARKKDFYNILEIVDDSITREIQLSHISINGTVLTIQGFAPNDKTIANFILKLQDNQLIKAVNIQEIFLDKDRQSRNFSIECVTQLPVPYIEDLSIEEEEEVEDFN